MKNPDPDSPLQLYAAQMGTGPDLCCIHGLLGNHHNWIPLARKLAHQYKVLIPDLRCHGKSPHGTLLTLSECVEDIRQLLTGKKIDRVHLMGHSLGGRLAMEMALQNPERIASLIIIDVVPKPYPQIHRKLLETLQHFQPENYTHRESMIAALEAQLEVPSLAPFLLKNVTRTPQGSFQWSIPIDTIKNSYPQLMHQAPATAIYEGPVLFIHGTSSNYLLPEDIFIIRGFFPQALVVPIDNAGHWIHVDNQEALLHTVQDFLKKQPT